jgi:hypothetical protein
MAISPFVARKVPQFPHMKKFVPYLITLGIALVAVALVSRFTAVRKLVTGSAA